MFLLYFICSCSFSLSKYACFDSLEGGKCDYINKQYQNKFVKYSLTELNNLFNESLESLNLAVFQNLGPINIPDDIILNEFSIISDFNEIELATQSQSLTLKKLNVQNITIKITTGSNIIHTLNITDDLIRNNSHFLPSNNNNKLRLIMHKCDSFLLLQDFDEFEIDINQSNEQKLSSFTFPSITNDFFTNSSISIIISDLNLIPDDFSLILFSSKEEDSLLVKSKSYTFSKNANFFKINTTLPLIYIHNCSDNLDIYINQNYCQLYEQNNLFLKFYSGIARFHDGCNSNIDLERSPNFSFLINSAFYDDSSCEIDSLSTLPLSIIASNNLNINLKNQNSSILGHLFIENGNITLKGTNTNQNDINYQFSCSSFVNYSEKNYNNKNKQLYSFVDLTEAEFYESITHLNLTSFVLLDENVIFKPKFLINAANIVGGTTVANLISEECSGIDFNPQTKLSLKENGTVIIPYHLNFNETYEGVMKVHHARYDYLVQRGENKTFDLDDFYNSFKYYYIKYMPVFNNFTEVFVKTYNQFYPPKIENDHKSINSRSKISIVDHHNNNLNHFVRLFVNRDDSPINSWYDTRFRPLICNFSIQNDLTFSEENYEIEFSNSLVSEFARVGEFKLDGELNFNKTTSCIDYRVKKPPTSSSELFVFLINNDLIDSVKHVPFVSIITPTTINSFYTMMRNNESRNVLIIVCEDMTDKIDFSKLRSDANIFIAGFSVKYMNEMIDFFNTIRRGNNLKKDLKIALEKISPKIPQMLPIVRLKLLESQSLTAVGVTIDKSMIACGSLTLGLCSFSGRTFVGATNLVADLYSVQNLLLKVINFRFVDVSIVPNFIGNKGGTTDLLSITKVEFDENGWFFFSKGTVYDNVQMEEQQEFSTKKIIHSSPSYNFGLPYIIAENELSIYSITDNIEFSLIQSKIMPKALHFISGQKVSKKLIKEKISILSTSDSENLVEIPESTTLSFTGKWDMIQNTEGQFSFEFGDSNAVIEKVPQSVDIVFSGAKNMTINCNNKNHKIKTLFGSGPISINSIDGDISIDSLIVKPFDTTFLNTNRHAQFLSVSQIECEKHSISKLNGVSSQKVVLNPDSKLELNNSNFEQKTTLKFNYNYDYEMPLLIINNSINLERISSIVMNYSRKHHSPYNPSFEKHLNKSRIFLKITDSKCSSFDNKNQFKFESDFSDFNSQNFLHLQCDEKGNDIEFSIKLFEKPSLKLKEKVIDSDQIKENPLNPPYLYIPTPSPTPKQNDMTVAIVGGSVGGVAFIGLVAFVVYFIVSGKKDDEALLDSLERRNARGEGEGLDETVENTIGASVDNTANESVESATSEEKKSDAGEGVSNLNEEGNQFKDDYPEKP